MIAHGQYAIRYYDEYFASWGEVCAAARHDGMSEVRKKEKQQGELLTDPAPLQLSLFSS